MSFDAANENTKLEEMKQREDDLLKEYSQNLVSGKKHLLCGDYLEAVTCFQTACSLQSERFGDTAPECAEVFYFYGRALLELAREENGVLGNALKGVPEEEGSDSDDEDCSGPNINIPGVAKILREATDRFISTGQFSKASPASSSRRLFDLKEEPTTSEDATCSTATEEGNSKAPIDVKEKSTTSGEGQSSSTSEEDQSKEAKSGEGSTSIESSNNAAASNESVPGTSGTGVPSSSGELAVEDPADDEAVENEEDIPNMQLAWEMLELAKVLFAKKPPGRDASLMIGQCCLKLGELSLEIENYSEAVADFLECLTLYQSLLAEDDRRLAEVHYSLGLAYNFDKQYEKCVDHYKAAHAVLEKRIKTLSEKISKNDTESEKVEEETEILEIKDLIPDILSKIEDVTIMKRQDRLDAASTSTGFPSSSSSSSTPVCNVIPVRKAEASSQQSAFDINHLVRRKRDNEDAAGSKATQSVNKKLKKDCDDEISKSSKIETTSHKVKESTTSENRVTSNGKHEKETAPLEKLDQRVS